MGKSEKGQPSPTDQPQCTYVIAAFNAYHSLSVVFNHAKHIQTIHHNLDQAIKKGATIITIRVITPRPLDQHQQEALFT